MTRALSAGNFRSSSTLRLLRFACRYSGPIPAWRQGPIQRIESPPLASILTTSAPRSPSICVAEGPITTVVRSSTRTPLNGPVAAVPVGSQTAWIVGSGILVGPWQSEHALGQIAEDQLARDRCQAGEHRLPEVTFDVAFAGVTHSAEGSHRAVRGMERGIGAQVLGRVGLRAAGLACIVELGRTQHHQFGGVQLGPALREWMLNRLVHPNRTIEHDAYIRVRGRLCQRAATDADGFGGVQYPFGIQAIEQVTE